jgi:phosphoribosylformylglycinamidine synthase
VGVVIDVTKVPVRETGMTPYEILLSESQERMLVVAHRGSEENVRAILAKWDLAAEVIGEVIADPVYRVTEGGRVVAEFPGSRLVTDCPRYSPPAREDPRIAELRNVDVDAIPELAEESDPSWTLIRLLSSPTIASKAWAYRQYDSTVRTNTVIGPGGDAGRPFACAERERSRIENRLQRPLRLSRSESWGGELPSPRLPGTWRAWEVVLWRSPIVSTSENPGRPEV